MKPISLLCQAASLAALVAVATGAAWSAAAPKSGILTYEVQIKPGGGAPQTAQQTIYFKGANTRTEMTSPMGKNVNIRNGAGMFALVPGKNEAMKINIPPGMKTAGAGTPFGDIALLRKQKKVGSEKVGRYQADIFEQKMNFNAGAAGPRQMSNRFWLTSEVPMPVKVVSKMPNVETTMVLKSAKLNAAVADSLFALPKGTVIRDMPSQIGMPGSPGASG